MFSYYSNECIRKLVVGFGTLFNRIYIKQKTSTGADRNLLVPLTYSPKEKFIKRLVLPSSISDRTRVEISIPQLAFEITNMAYDPTRKLNKTHKKIDDNGKYSWMEVPYNFTFGLYAYTRNIEENLQIMEQILPQFTPEFVISMNITDLHKKVDIPIVLAQTNLTQEYEGDFSSRRSIISTYIFVAKSYVYNKADSANTLQTITSWNFETEVDGVTFGIIGP